MTEIHGIISIRNVVAVLACCVFINFAPAADPATKLTPQSMVGKKPGDQTKNSINQKFCWCPAGSYKMGTPSTEAHRSYDEDQVDVTLTQGFWISKYEVTEREYKLIRNRSPKVSYGEDFPVVDMRSGDARQFAEKLTEHGQKAGAIAKNWIYAIPTEAEWEYACRADTTTAYSFGSSVNNLAGHGNFADQQLRQHDDSTFRYAHKKLDDGFAKLAPVGSFEPNAWGIHDMHGNAWEWCADSYFEKLPGGVNPIANGKGAERGRVIRGGSWLSHAHYCRSAMRQAHHDLNSAPYIGFRVVLKPKPN